MIFGAGHWKALTGGRLMVFNFCTDPDNRNFVMAQLRGATTELAQRWSEVAIAEPDSEEW